MKLRFLFTLLLALASSGFAGVTTTHPAGESQIFTGFANAVPFFDSAGKLTPLTLSAGQAARRNAAGTGFEAFSPQPLNANLTGASSLTLDATGNVFTFPVKYGTSWVPLSAMNSGGNDGSDNYPIGAADVGSGYGNLLYASALFDTANQRDLMQVGDGEIHFIGVGGVFGNDLGSTLAWKIFITGAVVAKTANYSASMVDGLIPVNAASGPITITLPASSGAGAGTGIPLRIVKIDSSANVVTIQRSGSDTINGATSTTLTARWQEGTFTDTGANSWIQAKGNNAGLALNNTFTGSNTFTGVFNVNPVTVSSSPTTLTIAGQGFNNSSGGTPGAVTIKGGSNLGADSFGSGGPLNITGGPSACAYGTGGAVNITGGLGTSGSGNGPINIGTTASGPVNVGSGANNIFLGNSNYPLKQMRFGTSGAMSGGTVTVTDAAATANTRYYLTPKSLGTVTVPQAAYVSARAPGTSFTITSASSSDTSVWNWEAIEQ